MKRIIFAVAVIAAFLQTRQAEAQTTVKMSAVKGNNYGVTYILPKTKILITATVKTTIRVRGEYHNYAERYLGVTDAIKKDETTRQLTNITAATIGVPDKSTAYQVEFRSNTQAPFVTLTTDGLLCAINSDMEYTPAVPPQALPQVPHRPRNGRKYLSEEALAAGSTAKEAELVAKQIFRLRETKNSILTGEADNMPPDGKAYDVVMRELSEQEQALREMFVGYQVEQESVHTLEYIPTDKNAERELLCRFSVADGIVPADDLSGEPIYLSLTNKTPLHTEILTEKEAKAVAEKFSKGIVYNIPSTAELQIELNRKTLLKKEIDVVQFGSQDVLTNKMFDNNKQPIKVIFYPDLGAIKQIVQ